MPVCFTVLADVIQLAATLCNQFVFFLRDLLLINLVLNSISHLHVPCLSVKSLQA
ncbi:Uncharacterised protein [Vibrio cholerae]|nr:hypothetical protein VIH_001590 [Vibrio cholerae CT 5369-93]CSB47790.1 Uncharacterised protein [Vibrio cholerae]CSC06277.1 Uncharacterised protein [Vibrio cholerae]CSC59318.1 Uncharacterised protein [Vibrio cholerae]CSD16339.1 Uncharacterised protein [Vibrio cholerae]